MPRHNYGTFSGRKSHEGDYENSRGYGRGRQDGRSVHSRLSPRGRGRGDGGISLHFRQRGNRGRPNSNAFRLIRRVAPHLRDRVLGAGDLDIEMERDPESWWKVTVMHGSKYDKHWLHDQLQSATRELSSGKPYVMWREEDRNVVYFLRLRRSQERSYRVAAQTVQAPDGHRLVVNINHVREPLVNQLTDSAVQALKTSLVTRWSAETNTLNLSKLLEDEALLAAGHYLPMNRICVVRAVAQILRENKPPVATLDLTGNRLVNVSAFQGLFDALNNTMKHVILSGNDLRGENCFDGLRTATNLESLIVENNPICSTRDEDELVTLIRDSVPSLVELNGKKLPPPIVFGSERPVRSRRRNELPKPALGYFDSDDTRTSILNFLKLYFEVYDKQRQKLMDQYIDDATLSITCSQTDLGYNHRPLKSYGEHSRNLLRTKDKERRDRLLYKGKLQVVSALDRLPVTMHILESLNVDVISNTPRAILLMIVGVFIEKDTSNKPTTTGTTSSPPKGDKTVRCFSRSLVLVPPLLVKLDDLYVTNASQDVIKHWISSDKSTTSRSAATAPTDAPVPHTAAAPPSEAVQVQLVTNFAASSGMNLEYSKLCLSDFGWDYEKAAAQFLEMKEKGLVPAEAFQQK